ncbi:NAD(P)-binding protein [Xylariaceae sp. FL1651]|nr:NAD(P)-binding protein [Xylariaceae sp. FL1651]
MAFPKGSLVLVTGVTGTIGAAVADRVLQAGYKIRAPIRNAEKGQLITELFHKRYGTEAFSTVMIPDMTTPGVFDEAMKDCAGVVHLASEMAFSPDPNKMIPPSLAMVNNVLTAASKTSSVKRVVYTSSQVTLPSISEPGVINGSSWQPRADEVIAHAWAEPYTPDKARSVYVAGKISAERACWDFVKREKPSFVLNTVVPGFVIGESIHPKLVSSSNSAILGMLDSDPFSVGFLRGISPASSVNLDDTAVLHLAALIREDVSNERLLALGETFDFNRLVDVLEQLAPGSNLPARLEDPGKQVAEIDTKREVELLKALGKGGFTGFEESVRVCFTSAKPTNDAA